MEKGFGKLLLDAVDSALSSFGDSAKRSVYFHLENKFALKKEQIPNRVEDFDSGLEQIFGLGTRFLEVLIMKNLYNKLGSKGAILTIEHVEEFKFADYVRAAKRAYSLNVRKQ